MEEGGLRAPAALTSLVAMRADALVADRLFGGSVPLIARLLRHGLVVR